MLEIVYHCNPQQPHQVEHGQWFAAGFKRHGIDLTITPNAHHLADVHIVSGPHYARRLWQGHPRVILLDRAYYHEGKTGRWHSMDWVSLGWMNSMGIQVHRAGTGRAPPERQPIKTEGGTIFFADYCGPVEEADTVRLHPANETPTETLEEAISRHRHAIGYTSTALVQAALAGLTFECRVPDYIMSRPDWLEVLPYADWRWDEIASGEAWEHFRHDIDIGDCPGDRAGIAERRETALPY